MFGRGNHAQKLLQNDVEELRREVRRLKEDYEGLQDKVYRWMQRAVQRTKRESSVPTMDRFDLVNVDPVSAKILERRQRSQPKRNDVQGSTVDDDLEGGGIPPIP
jgi:hypothetical protein